MKALVIGALIAASFNTFAMRCGTDLVLEGDSAQKMITLCGKPQEASYNNFVYVNKDGDGMNYRIHTQSNGVIDNISFGK